MTETGVAGEKSANKSAHLVWLLVLLGLATGACTLFLVRTVLNEIRAGRAELNHTQNAIDGLDAGMTRGFTEAQEQIQQLLAAQQPNSSSSDGIEVMVSALNDLERSLQNPEITPSVAGMKHLLADLSGLRTRCTQWNTEYLAVQTDLTERKKAVDASVVAIRAALSTAEGRER